MALTPHYEDLPQAADDNLNPVVPQGDEIILAKCGKPVAKMVPYGGVAPSRVPGCMEGEIRIAPDFDQLPDDMAEAFGIAESGR